MQPFIFAQEVRKGIVLAFFATLLAFSSAWAQQDLPKGVKYIWGDFSKGLVSAKSSFNLQKGEASIAENIRFSDKIGALSKRDEILEYGDACGSDPVLGIHRLYEKDGTQKVLVNCDNTIKVGDDSAGTFSTLLTVGTSGHRWQWVTWHDLAIGTDGYNQPVKCTSSICTYLGSAHAADAGSGAGPDGTYTYKITFYTTTYEVSFDTASNSIVVSDNDIDLTEIPIGPNTYLGENVTGRKVYRTGDGDSTYVLLSNGTIANNTATTLTDSDTDAARSGALAPDSTYAPPVGKIPLIHFDRIFIAGDPSYSSRLYWSEDDSHDFFLDSASTSHWNIREDDGDSITMLEAMQGTMVIGKNNTIQKFYLDGPTPSTDWSYSDPFGYVGCQSIYSVDNSPYGLIYLGRDGLYIFNGQTSKLISQKIAPTILDILTSNYDQTWGVYHKNKYYLAYTSTESGSTTNNRVLVYDFLADSFSIDLLNINVFKVFDSGTDVDILYSGQSDGGDVYYHGITSYQVIHKKHSDFEGVWDDGVFDDMRYIPTNIGGDADDPILELAWTETIDELSGTIDAAIGIIDRPDTDGTFLSKYLTIGASSLGKLYWNERMPVTGGDVTFDIRSGTSTTDCSTAGWTTGFTNPAGSDISTATADTVVQYRINMSTNDIDYTPNLIKNAGYVVKFTYDTVGSSTETTVPLHWRDGWVDLGWPGHPKELKGIEVWYESEQDTVSDLVLTFETFQGDTDVFTIDLNQYPDYYAEKFTTGMLVADLIRLDILETSLYDLEIDKIVLIYDVAPMRYVAP